MSRLDVELLGFWAIATAAWIGIMSAFVICGELSDPVFAIDAFCVAFTLGPPSALLLSGIWWRRRAWRQRDLSRN